MIDTPNRAAKPTPVETLKFIPRTSNAATPPMKAKGIVSNSNRAARNEPNVIQISAKMSANVTGTTTIK